MDAFVFFVSTIYFLHALKHKHKYTHTHTQTFKCNQSNGI